MANFPNEQELKNIRKRVAKAKGTQGLPPDALPLDRAKHDVCEQLLIYMKKKRLSQREFAKLLQTSETRVSEIVHYRIQKFHFGPSRGFFADSSSYGNGEGGMIYNVEASFYSKKKKLGTA